MINADPYPELDQAHVQALFAAARQVVADAYAAIAALAAGSPAAGVPLFQLLPRKYLPRYDQAFAQRFAAAATTVAWKLADPSHVHGLACTAEDMALKCILDVAGQTAGGEQLEEFAAAVLDDDTFLMLWDQSRDGSEDRLPAGANLSFADWFEPFSDREPVHPFLQPDASLFLQLWEEGGPPEDDLVDPVTEVFIALGEDWLDAPDQVTDQIPSIIAENQAALFPETATRNLTPAQREQVFESAAGDVRVLLEAARRDPSASYDVWLLRDAGPGRPKARQSLHAGLPLDEALNLRKLERMGEYRGVTDVELRVYPTGSVQ